MAKLIEWLTEYFSEWVTYDQIFLSLCRSERQFHGIILMLTSNCLQLEYSTSNRPGRPSCTSWGCIHVDWVAYCRDTWLRQSCHHHCHPGQTNSMRSSDDHDHDHCDNMTSTMTSWWHDHDLDHHDNTTSTTTIMKTRPWPRLSWQHDLDHDHHDDMTMTSTIMTTRPQPRPLWRHDYDLDHHDNMTMTINRQPRPRWPQP